MRRMVQHTPRLLRIGVAVALVVAVLSPAAVLAVGGTFTDDETSTFEADIEWLAGAGVTLGCNPPDNDNFCPEQAVTRGQMAAFMHRLAVNQVVDAATAAQAENADLLDGSPISHYNNPSWGNEPGGAQSTPMSGGNQKWVEYTITTIGGGGVVINATAAIHDANSDASALFWVQVDNTTCSNSPANIQSVGYGYVTVDSGEYQSMAITGAAQLDEGSHTLTLCGREFSTGGGDTVVHSASMTAVFSVAGAYIPLAADVATGGPIPGSVQD